MRRAVERLVPFALLSILCLGFVVSLYWQFVKGLRPCPYCQALRWLYVGGAALGAALWRLRGREALFWAGLLWAVPTSVVSVLPFLTHCVECLRAEGTPFWGPLSAYHLALLGAAGVAALSAIGLLLPQEGRRGYNRAEEGEGGRT